MSRRVTYSWKGGTTWNFSMDTDFFFGPHGLGMSRVSVDQVRDSGSADLVLKAMPGCVEVQNGVRFRATREFGAIFAGCTRQSSHMPFSHSYLEERGPRPPSNHSLPVA